MYINHENPPMSYARFSEGDVYIIATTSQISKHGHWECISCRLRDIDPDTKWYRTATLWTRKQLLDHINQHIASGHKVPERCIERIKEESELNFIDLFLRNEIEFDEINDYIEQWYSSEAINKDIQLYTYLGMTQEQFKLWVAEPSKIEEYFTQLRENNAATKTI